MFEVAKLEGKVKTFKDEPRGWVHLRLPNRHQDELIDWLRRHLREGDTLRVTIKRSNGHRG